MTLAIGSAPALVVGILLFLGGTANAGDADVEGALEEPALPEWGKGPFEMSDPFVLAQLRMAPYARSPRTLAPFELEVGGRGYWENSYGIASNQPVARGHDAIHRFTLDAESRGMTLVARM